VDLVGELIAFLVQTALRLIRDRDTRAWPTVEGVIHASSRSSSIDPTAEVTYMYSVDGERYFGVHKRSFLLGNSADDYAKRFIPEWKVTVRYCEKDPQKSFVSERDQVMPPVWATRFR